MVKTITASTAYATKRKFQAEGPTAWVTIKTKSEAGEDVQSRHRLKDVAVPGVEITVRDGWPSSVQGKDMNHENSKLQPSWMAKVRVVDRNIIIE